jgi:hypothetical protein
MNRFLLRFAILVMMGFGFSPESYAQEDDYDYVLPEDPDLDNKSRSKVSLPIKTQTEDQNFVIPSYFESNDDAMKALSEADKESGKKSKGDNRTSVQMELGSSVSTDFKGNSAITTYVSPHIRHQLSDDVAISGGVIVSQTFLNGWTDYSIDGRPMPSSITNTTIYGRIDYRLSERMLVYGAVYQNISSMPNRFGHGNQTQGLGYSAGMNYKISDKSFLQIEIHRNSGYNPFSPYSRSYGFGGMPFNSFP